MVERKWNLSPVGIFKPEQELWYWLPKDRGTCWVRAGGGGHEGLALYWMIIALRWEGEHSKPISCQADTQTHRHTDRHLPECHSAGIISCSEKFHFNRMIKAGRENQRKTCKEMLWSVQRRARYTGKDKELLMAWEGAHTLYHLCCSLVGGGGSLFWVQLTPPFPPYLLPLLLSCSSSGLGQGVPWETEPPCSALPPPPLLTTGTPQKSQTFKQFVVSYFFWGATEAGRKGVLVGQSRHKFSGRDNWNSIRIWTEQWNMM